MNVHDIISDGSKKFRLADYPTNLNIDKAQRLQVEEDTNANTLAIAELQDKLYAEGREGVIVLFQAMDAAGKDSTIKRVFSGVNPQGIVVTSFKTPTSKEAAHGFLWRSVPAIADRGMMTVFNRSYYEECLVVRVRELWRNYKMPQRVVGVDEDTYFDWRYRAANDYERYLWESGFRVVKFFLNVSPEEQEKRFFERIDDPAKNWKFSASDIVERQLWHKYMDAYEKMIAATSTEIAPWYVVPADQKWVMRYLVSQAVVDVMRDCSPQYPVLPAEEKAKLDEARARLLGDEDVSHYKPKTDRQAKAPKEKKAKGSGKKSQKAKQADAE